MFMIMLILNSLNTLFIKNPLSMGVLIIFQTILLSMKMILMVKNSWFSFIIFITMIGGMMIMFIYMSSIASSEKFKTSKKIFAINTMLFMTLFYIIMYSKSMEEINKMNIIISLEQEPMTNLSMNEQEKSIIKFLSFKKMNLMIFLTSILMLILMLLTWTNFSFKGPLKKTYE